MDNTALTSEVAHLFRISGHKVDTGVEINHREIDVRAEETQGLIRKIILVECADYNSPVGVSKIQEDLNKLEAAREQMKENVILMHVSRNGYSKNASGYALDKGIDIFPLISLTHQLVNFDSYIKAVENDKARDIILNEYQPTKIHFDGRSRRQAKPAMDFINDWISGSSRWLTILADYGVGKSWMLKRFRTGSRRTQEKSRRISSTIFCSITQFTKALGAIVGEGDVGVFGEAQHSGLVVLQPLPQIMGIGLGHFAALAVLARWDGWMLTRPLGEDGAVAFLQRLVLARAQHLVVAFRDLMTGAKEQTLHALGPGVAMGVDDEGKLAQHDRTRRGRSAHSSDTRPSSRAPPRNLP